MRQLEQRPKSGWALTGFNGPAQVNVGTCLIALRLAEKLAGASRLASLLRTVGKTRPGIERNGTPRLPAALSSKLASWPGHHVVDQDSYRGQAGQGQHKAAGKLRGDRQHSLMQRSLLATLSTFLIAVPHMSLEREQVHLLCAYQVPGRPSGGGAKALQGSKPGW